MDRKISETPDDHPTEQRNRSSVCISKNSTMENAPVCLSSLNQRVAHLMDHSEES